MFNILGQENKFEKLAEIAANEHMDNSVSLNDSIVKLAEENELNPEQIKRVVEAANIKVFQKNFADEAREGHKNVDFDVADPKVIIRRIFVIKKKPMEDPMMGDIDDGECPMMSFMKATESPDMPHVPSPLDFFKDLAMDNFDSKPKVKVTIMKSEPEEKSVDRPTLVIRLKKAKANLEKKAYELSEQYVEKLNEFSRQFKASGSDPKEFASLCKEAYDHKGADITPILQSVANASRKDMPTYENHEATYGMCKVAGYPSKNLNQVFELEKLAEEYRKCEKAAQLAEEQLNEMK